MINFYFFTIGTCIASFLGLVVDRFPKQSILAPRSHCDHCQHVLGVWDLIPIISQLLHRFRFATIVIRPTHFGTAFLRSGWPALFGLCQWFSFSASPSNTTGAAVLAIYDLRFMEYPLVIWCCIHALVLFYPVVISSCWSFYSLAIGLIFSLSEWGRRDFLLLATFSLSFSSTQILILIQIASILGILVFALKKKRPDSLCSLSLSQLSRFTALYNVLQIRLLIL